MLPWAMPAFVAFLTWRVLYQPIGGGINLVLTQTGIWPYVVDWLGQRSTAMASVIIASVWRGFPFWFVSILAALQSVPKELYEAATVDGADPWQRFWLVTFPGIRQVVIVTTLLSSIWTANALRACLAADPGRAVRRDDGFPVLAYLGMQTQRIGEAAAVSVAMLPVLAILVIVGDGVPAAGRDDERRRDARNRRLWRRPALLDRILTYALLSSPSAGALSDLLDDRHVAEAAARDLPHALALAARADARTITTC